MEEEIGKMSVSSRPAILSPLRRLKQEATESSSGQLKQFAVGQQNASCTGRVQKMLSRQNCTYVHILSADNDVVYVKSFGDSMKKLKEVSVPGNVVRLSGLKVAKIHDQNFHHSPFPFELHFTLWSVAETVKSSVRNLVNSFAECDVGSEISIVCGMLGGFQQIGTQSFSVDIVDRCGMKADLIIHNPTAKDFGNDHLIKLNAFPVFYEQSLQFILKDVKEIEIVAEVVPDDFLNDDVVDIVPVKKMKKEE